MKFTFEICVGTLVEIAWAIWFSVRHSFLIRNLNGFLPNFKNGLTSTLSLTNLMIGQAS